MIATFVFNETTPSAPGTAPSSQAVMNSANYLPPGVCGPLDDWDSLDIIAEITGATGGVLNVYLQGSPDGGVNWYDLIAWPQAAAGAGVKYYQSPLSLATTTSTTPQVGKNLSPALAAGTVINGAWTDRFRLVMVAGASTTAGAPLVVRIAPQRPRMREHGGM